MVPVTDTDRDKRVCEKQRQTRMSGGVGWSITWSGLLLASLPTRDGLIDYSCHLPRPCLSVCLLWLFVVSFFYGSLCSVRLSV